LIAVYGDQIDAQVFAAIASAVNLGLTDENMGLDPVHAGEILRVFTTFPKFDFAKKFLTRREKEQLSSALSIIGDVELQELYGLT
jgi:hypothetical protein